MTLNSHSVEAVAGARTSPQFMRPLYESYCFANLPATIKHALGVSMSDGALPTDTQPRPHERYDAVVLMFIDALGWRFIEPRLDDYDFLRHVRDNGVVSKLTSQFPSTTAAHVTCIHTGLPPAQSGVYEWGYYEPKLDMVYQPLMMSPAGDMRRDTLMSAGVDARALLPTRTIFQDLADEGITSAAFQSRSISPSAYSNVMLSGAKTRAFRTLAEAAVNLGEAVVARRERQYFFFYFDGIDTIAHQYGPNSIQVDAEIDAFLTVMARQFLARARGRAKRTLLLMTADHGVCETDPDTTLYLNLALPDIARWLKVNRIGQPIVPCGSPRDFFLHIADDKLDDARAVLERRLSSVAEVRPVAEMIEQGYFGPQPSAEFLSRVGNLVVLPFRGESVWWYEKDKFEQNFFGHHGGLAPVEMEIPLLACELG